MARVKVCVHRPAYSMSASGRDESRPYIPDGGHLLLFLATAGEKYGVPLGRKPTGLRPLGWASRLGRTPWPLTGVRGSESGMAIAVCYLAPVYLAGPVTGLSVLNRSVTRGVREQETEPGTPVASQVFVSGCRGMGLRLSGRTSGQDQPSRSRLIFLRFRFRASTCLSRFFSPGLR